MSRATVPVYCAPGMSWPSDTVSEKRHPTHRWVKVKGQRINVEDYPDLYKQFDPEIELQFTYMPHCTFNLGRWRRTPWNDYGVNAPPERWIEVTATTHAAYVHQNQKQRRYRTPQNPPQNTYTTPQQQLSRQTIEQLKAAMKNGLVPDYNTHSYEQALSEYEEWKASDHTFYVKEMRDYFGPAD